MDIKGKRLLVLGGAVQCKKFVEAAKNFGFQIAVKIRDDNIASQRVASKNGFVPTEEYIEKEYPKAGIVKLRKYVLK